MLRQKIRGCYGWFYGSLHSVFAIPFCLLVSPTQVISRLISMLLYIDFRSFGSFVNCVWEENKLIHGCFDHVLLEL
jgi:hypothetical protein